MLGEQLERLGANAKARNLRIRVIDEIMDSRDGTVYAKVRCEGRLSVMLRLDGLILNIVGNLKREPQVLREFNKIPAFIGRTIQQIERNLDGGNKQRARLAAVNLLKRLEIGGLARHFQIEMLSEDESRGADALGQKSRRAGGRSPLQARLIGQPKGVGQRTHRGQNGRGLARRNVKRGATAPFRRVIHAGQVVENERSRVREFNGASGIENRAVGCLKDFRNGEGADRPDALATAEGHVPDAVIDGRGRTIGSGEACVHVRVNGADARLQIFQQFQGSHDLVVRSSGFGGIQRVGKASMPTHPPQS